MSRYLVVYDDATEANGGERLYALSPNAATGVPIPAFRTVVTLPATGVLVGEAVLNTTNGLSYVWDGTTWNPIVPPSIVPYATDNAVWTDTTANAGTYAFSRATGNLFVRFNNGTADVWRQIGTRTYLTQTSLLADNAVDGSIGFATDTNSIWFRVGGTWVTASIIKDTEANIRVKPVVDGQIAVATDTSHIFIGNTTTNQWQQLGVITYATERALIADSPIDGTTGYAQDTGMVWHYVNGVWESGSIYRDTQANILASAPTSGKLAITTDTGKIFVGDGAAWIGQPFRDYPTEAALLAANPPDGTLAIAIDTGFAHYRTGGTWSVIGANQIPIGTADPPVATATTGDVYFNSTLKVLKLFDGRAWQTTGIESQWAVGSIQQSILDETQFNNALPASERAKWVLADGRDITGSVLAGIIGTNNIPDLRGTFLRMAGTNGTNAWNGGTLGSHNDFKTARPKTIFQTNDTGNHNHNLWIDSKSYNKPMWDGDEALGRTADANAAYRWRHRDWVSSEGNHHHTITGGGDDETVPRHYSLNFFIKIN